MVCEENPTAMGICHGCEPLTNHECPGGGCNKGTAGDRPRLPPVLSRLDDLWEENGGTMGSWKR